MTSLQMLAGLAPEVAARTDTIGGVDAPAFFLSLAAARLTASAWGNCYQQAVCYLAAHLATKSPASATYAAASAGLAGPVTGRTTGDRSESYGSASAGVSGLTAGDAEMMTTSYGREFLALRRTRAASAPRVMTSASPAANESGTAES